MPKIKDKSTINIEAIEKLLRVIAKSTTTNESLSTYENKLLTNLKLALSSYNIKSDEDKEEGFVVYTLVERTFEYYKNLKGIQRKLKRSKTTASQQKINQWITETESYYNKLFINSMMQCKELETIPKKRITIAPETISKIIIRSEALNRKGDTSIKDLCYRSISNAFDFYHEGTIKQKYLAARKQHDDRYRMNYYPSTSQQNMKKINEKEIFFQKWILVNFLHFTPEQADACLVLVDTNLFSRDSLNRYYPNPKRFVINVNDRETIC